MNFDSKILVTGDKGLVGRALIRELRKIGHDNIIVFPRKEVDLTDPVAVKWAFSVYEPEYVFHCAAKVGGIRANIDQPLEFFLQNAAIQTNVLENACAYNIKKLLFMGSSCVYPKNCLQPIKEEYLLTAPFTPEVEPYGLAKVCGIKLCQWYRKEKGCNFISAIPCNLFGEHDNFNERTAHVIPGMMARMHNFMLERSRFEYMPAFRVWGNGDARREFLYSRDLAKALILLMEKYDEPEPINAGSGFELSIREVAQAIATTLGYRGEIDFDSSAPVGTPRKIMDNSRINSLKWTPTTPWLDALWSTYDSFLSGHGKR